MWESCTLAFPCSVNGLFHDGIASYTHFHGACLLVFSSFVRNSVVLAVYLLFSVACFFTVHEHSCMKCYRSHLDQACPVTQAAILNCLRQWAA
ncbi:hypothetical protein EBB54_23080 [Schaedlerella arabinosiphila]|uniref:Uncharacterized protein n=1 Tax=Schaedlerella arabinosiphila TaxID=2044587 RepID=A0A3R8JSB3_9FIRM|nr:hypothetical protein EBB54_23080 [Schaedlerella arabinosiphila]